MMKRWRVGGGRTPPIKPVGSAAGGRWAPPARSVIPPLFDSGTNGLNIPRLKCASFKRANYHKFHFCESRSSC